MLVDSVHKSFDENTKMERLKEVKRVLLPMHKVLPGVHILTPVLPVVPTTNSSLKHAEYTV